jgi:ribosome-binding ATPase YchF (GTP1/OBG family)
MTKDEERLQSGFKFLTDKPRLVLFNVSEPDLQKSAGLAGDQSFVLSAALEAEIATLPEAERAEFLKSYGLSEPLSRRAARSAFAALDLISFFTVGEDEVRAWAIDRGADAVTAAGKIHTDLARGFIRAEVVPYASAQAATNQKDYKQLAKQDLKGKEYVVCDGDIINIRFSV